MLQPMGSQRVKHNLVTERQQQFLHQEIYFKEWAHAIVGDGKWQVGRVAGWQLRQELMAGFEAEFLLLQETSVFMVKAFPMIR